MTASARSQTVGEVTLVREVDGRDLDPKRRDLHALVLEHWRSDAFVVYGEVLDARRIAADCVLVSEDDLPDWREYDLILALGGPMSVYDEAENPWLVGEKRLVREAVAAGIPYFGVCFGSQLLASALGADVYRGPAPELGLNPVFLTEAAHRDPVFRGLPRDLEVFEWHRDTFDLPSGAVRLARSPRYTNQAMRVGRIAYGIQCHLEKSAADIAKALEAAPDFLRELEKRHDRAAVDAFLAGYAEAVPFLQETARQILRRWLDLAGAVGGAASAGPSRAPRGRADDLIAREAEQARLTNLLSRAREGGSGAVVLRGDAGMGKTALLEWTVEQAAAMRVVRCAGHEARAELPYGGLRALCAPLLDEGIALPPAAAALSSALSLEEARSPGDRFAVYVAFTRLLAGAAMRMPILVAVDDAHWLDEASAEALAFAIGRGAPPGTAMVLATEGEAFGGRGASDLTLDRLDRTAMTAILEARVDDGLDPAVTDGLLRIAAGNPLTLLAFAGNLTVGSEEADAPALPHPRATAEEAFLHRILRLPPDTRRGLVVGALDAYGDPATVSAACRDLGLDFAGLDRAEQLGLIAVGQDAVEFRHPLVRSAVIYNAPLAERQAAHGALARQLTGPIEAERRAWHLARGASGPDETAARALDATARRALDHRAPGAAARAYELAARLTGDAEAHARRLLNAADASYRAGNVAAALDHLEAARPGATRATLRRVDHLRGRILARFGSAEAARAILVGAADRCERGRPHTAALMLADAVIPCLRSGLPRDACELGLRAFALAEDADAATRFRTSLMLGTALIFTGEFEAGRDLVNDAAALAEALPDGGGEQRAYIGRSLRLAGYHERSREVFAALVADARAECALGLLPYALARFADLELEEGRWEVARELLREAIRLARETGQAADEGLALGTLAWLDAAQGREEDCQANARAASELAVRLGTGSQLDRAGLAPALLELGRGRPEVAIALLEPTIRQQRDQGWSDAAVTPHASPDLIEAYVLAGRVADGEALLRAFEEAARRSGRKSAHAAAARCRGLLHSGDDGERWFARASAYGSGDVSPFDLGRTELRYAQHLRRAGEPVLARVKAESALERFTALGAEPWARQARDAVDARVPTRGPTGGRPRR